MKIILFIFYFIFIWTFLFGRVKFNDRYDINIWQRAFVCFICSLICTFILGFPLIIIFGIISLFT